MFWCKASHAAINSKQNVSLLLLASYTSPVFVLALFSTAMVLNCEI